ncbi:MAG: EVE domain-containing protein [Bacteroidota bacterium]
MNYWLIKSEPETYSWDDFVKLGRDHWDGVRNFKARNNIKLMKVGDQCLFYHSVSEKSVVGVAEVVKEHYPDPTTGDDRWYVMDITPLRKLKRPVTLIEIKADERLNQMKLVTHPRLSVQPVTQEEFDIIIALSEQKMN